MRLRLKSDWIVLFLCLLVLPLAAEAHRKTDVITLYNGDRITGEIKSLLGGRMALSTDAMGTITIEWKEIASLDSNYNYEIRLVSGERFFGNVKPASVPGSVAVRDVFGDRDLSWDEIVELRPIEESALDRIDIYLSANYAFTKASGVTQTELRANISYEDESAQNALNSRVTVSDTDEETTTSSRISLSRKAWTQRQAIYRILFGGHETNDELGLDYRITIGAGLGRYLVDTNNSTLTVSLGLQALDERSIGGEQQESVEAVIDAEYARWRFDTPELDLTLGTTLYPSLTEGGRVRADTTARLRWEIIEDLYWDFSTWGTYDSSAVDEEAGEFDWGVTTGVGWNF